MMVNDKVYLTSIRFSISYKILDLIFANHLMYLQICRS